MVRDRKNSVNSTTMRLGTRTPDYTMKTMKEIKDYLNGGSNVDQGILKDHQWEL